MFFDDNRNAHLFEGSKWIVQHTKKRNASQRVNMAGRNLPRDMNRIAKRMEGLFAKDKSKPIFLAENQRLTQKYEDDMLDIRQRAEWMMVQKVLIGSLAAEHEGDRTDIVVAYKLLMASRLYCEFEKDSETKAKRVSLERQYAAPISGSTYLQSVIDLIPARAPQG
ncbi:MAG: hypothetical protein V3U82_05125 [Robiginitomaculum sp.]